VHPGSVLGGTAQHDLVMCPSHITHKWAREILLTIPRARAFLIADLRNGGAPGKPYGVCEVRLSKGRTIYEGTRTRARTSRRRHFRCWNGRCDLSQEKIPSVHRDGERSIVLYPNSLYFDIGGMVCDCTDDLE
jgi:hypothetical protein